MKFGEFEKMSTSLDRFDNSKPFEKEEWIVMEKVHGANFSLHINKDHEVKPARRRGILRENENFFSFRDAEFMKMAPEKMKKIFSDIVSRFPEKDISQVSVWGELYGGTYVIDEKDLNETKTKPIQLEVQYCPNIDWIAYDISYRTADNLEKHEYLDYDVAMEIFKTHDIFYLKPIFKGKMNEALNFDLNFDSTIPKVMNLPDLPKGTNVAEGIVAKPMKNIVCKDKYDEDVRVIVKLKSLRFQEIKDTVPPARKAGKNKQNKEPNLLSKIMEYATEQRMTNAISKHGFPDTKEIQETIVEEFLEDILVDIKEDVELFAEWDKTSETEKAKIKTKITGEGNGLVQKIKNSR